MVFALVILTVIIFFVVDYFMRKEEKSIQFEYEPKKTPIFLSPEKSLLPLGNDKLRYFHPSHSWVMQVEPDIAFVGLDNFVSSIFSGDVKIQNTPSTGSFIRQGTKIWDLQINGHKITQLAPVSGEVIGINPACNANIPLASKMLEKSWVVKINPVLSNEERSNLLNYSQANMINTALVDEFKMLAHDGHYLNDGGEIDPGYINQISQEEWDKIVDKFFPYENENKFV